MSKTTILLFIILLVAVCILGYIIYGSRQNAIITSLTHSISTPSITEATNLSFTTNEQSIQRGQTITAAVLIHNPNPHPSLVQLEISYDPTVFIINSLTPGTFFTNPTIALQNIDPVTGRISFALHCPASSSSNTLPDCVNPNSPTLAVITLSVNSYAVKNTTALSFLPKTVIRTQSGRDILQNTTGLQLTIGKQLYPVSSTSAIASPGANLIRVR